MCRFINLEIRVKTDEINYNEVKFDFDVITSILKQQNGRNCIPHYQLH